MKKCLNCGKEFDGNYCPECGKQLKDNSIFKDKYTPSIIASIIISLILLILLSIIFYRNCSNTRYDGTYYLQSFNGTIDKETYIELKSGKWSDEDNETGTYKTDSNKIIFYVDFFGEKVEYISGTIVDDVLTLDEAGFLTKYIKLDN